MPNRQDLDHLGYLGPLGPQGGLDVLDGRVPGIGGIRPSCVPDLVMCGSVSIEIHPPASPNGGRGSIDSNKAINRASHSMCEVSVKVKGIEGNGRTEICPNTTVLCRAAAIEENMANILRSKLVYRRGSTSTVGFSSLSSPKRGSFGNWRNALRISE